MAVVALLATTMVAGLALVAVRFLQPDPPDVPTSDAEPYVASFAQDLDGDVREPLPDEPEPYSQGPNLDGCDHAYGTNGECVPYNFPKSVADTPQARCRWLAQQGFRALEVPGRDRHRLVPPGGPRAPSGNPYACPDQLPPR